MYDLNRPTAGGLYDPAYEHDACGMGFVAQVLGLKSHEILEEALDVLENLSHRGASGADEDTGDGAGILVQIPHGFFRRECRVLGFDLPGEGAYGVGMLFLHKYEEFRKEQVRIFEALAAEECLRILGWREVPVDRGAVGQGALEGMPYFSQVFVARPEGLDGEMEFERRLYVLRKRAENAIAPLGEEKGAPFYLSSLSSRTVVYKGMLTATQLRNLYLDLSDLDFVTALAMVHSRFSTNTFPSWERAHPNRYIVHNGEINTIRGNVNWMKARQQGIVDSPLFEDVRKVFPIIDESGSDSAMFDNSLEFMYLAGRSLEESVMMMIPEPWEKDDRMSGSKREFYKHSSFVMKPWDGPAAIGFTDGVKIGAVLDRNGLRPARYYVTRDDKVILASEVGVADVRPENIRSKGRLEPGKMLLIDTREGRIIADEEIKEKAAGAKPFREWNSRRLAPLGDFLGEATEPKEIPGEALLPLQKAFGYTFEDVETVLAPMARDGKEPLGSMGMDSPLAVLSEKPQPLYLYFKQLFAQVTNPPIDGIREELITSSQVMLGVSGNLLEAGEGKASAILLEHPILTSRELEALRNIRDERFRPAVLSMLYKPGSGARGMEKALERIFREADQAIAGGANILILSDRGVGPDLAAVPALLASSALHHHLVRREIRTDLGLVLESGEPREIHHFCTLIGYGVTALNPYLALDTVSDLAGRGLLGSLGREEAVRNFIDASIKGIMKVVSKMGIATVESYHGSQIFEAIGLSGDFIEKYFTSTPSRLEGIGLEEIAEENRLRHESAYHPASPRTETLEVGGCFRCENEGEAHLYNPESIYLLQQACRKGDYGLFREFSGKIHGGDPYTLRQLMDFNCQSWDAIPIEEVEPVESIVRRFKTGAMSYGSISKEAHECLAVAMNRLGGKSNTGEGGEDPERFDPLPNGDSRNSAIKQVASGRFGVTGSYLLHAQEIQIKMAQGAKPGEGGQLPGNKVYPWVARERHSTPGVGLISPPPHHDIYSIEDLAELIHDLKNANPRARINVKLVSEVGVGTIAAGVAKGKADVILISGYDGGTGASPRTSIRNTGLPWELGLAETQQTLLLNRLRDRVVLETDGKLLTGRDVAVAALLGAEEFGFATTPLISMGCLMMRVCNLNTCPVGIATQDEELRKNFRGKPEHVENFMRFVAMELRELMARMGFRTVREMVGRTDKLRSRENIRHWKASRLDLSSLFHQPYVDARVGRCFSTPQNHGLERSLDGTKLLPMFRKALEEGKPMRAKLKIRNVNRVVGTLTGSELTRLHGEAGLPDDTIRISFVGSAGQSFGAFLPKGMTLDLEGDANDYIGKGLSGGRLVVRPPVVEGFVPRENILIGNVAFYGATSGEAFLSGIAGERFLVRNSGAVAVVEGAGNHGCEYMTGGCAVVLGPVGRNFAAGMSGGTAYLLDLDEGMCNQEMVLLERVEDPRDAGELEALVRRHREETGSSLAGELLDSWEASLGRFTKVIPRDYKRMLASIEEAEASGLTGEEALMLAFERNYKGGRSGRMERGRQNG